MLEQALDELDQAAGQRDVESFHQAVHAVWTAGENAGPAERDAALVRIGALLADIPANHAASRLAVLGGAFVEHGGGPVPIVTPVFAGLMTTLRHSATLIETWPHAEERPDPNDSDYEETVRVLTGAHSEQDARDIAQAWYSLTMWAMAASALLQVNDVRTALPDKAAVFEAVDGIVRLREDLGLLYELLSVLDDERLVVLHKPTGRGYEVTISGVAGNFQLQTLLAARLCGAETDGLIEGVRPEPAWIAAATDGELVVPGGIGGQFNLVDHTGSWIWGEGLPSDIPELDGRRVVVLEPPPYQRTWNPGRTFARLRPDVRLDRILPSAEVAGWLTRMA